MTLQADHVTVRGADFIGQVRLQITDVGSVGGNRAVQSGDGSRVEGIVHRVVGNGGVQQNVRSLTGQLLCVERSIEILVSVLQAGA